MLLTAEQAGSLIYRRSQGDLVMEKSEYEELKEEMRLLKERVAALEEAIDAILAPEDLQAIREAHEDLKQGKTISLEDVRKKYF